MTRYVVELSSLTSTEFIATSRKWMPHSLGACNCGLTLTDRGLAGPAEEFLLVPDLIVTFTVARFRARIPPNKIWFAP